MKKYYSILFLSLILFCGCKKTPVYTSFADYPVYEGGDMELTYTPQACSFRVWSPTATQMKILLYDNGYEGGAYQTLDMEPSENGTWTLKVEENLKGKFYIFQARIGDRWMEETPGMWVKATGLNGKRAAIVDLADSNPAGWDRDTRPAQTNFTDMILYELHIRDYTTSPNSGIKNKGKYLAFTEHNTTNTAGEATGIDHLMELGVTHVQLMPCCDFAAIDEANANQHKYNSGYDPVNFNVPEGSYSTNAKDPLVRIREFKQMVQAFHKAGIRVILDMPFSHTAIGKGSHFDVLAPDYFYRKNADSTWANGSGFGNEMASERGMMRQFMIESVVYWATEYHIDGFHFDMMGLQDIETMNEIRAALDKVDPTIFVYGDGWTKGISPLNEKSRAVKKNTKLLNNVAVFNEDLYNVLKGRCENIYEQGFVTASDSLEENIRFGVTGATQHTQINYAKLLYSKAAWANNPTQTVNFASYHGDMGLVEKLRASQPGECTSEELKQMNKLAQTVIFTSQGIPFLYEGEEIYRNKKTTTNTAQTPDSINYINWNLKTANKDILDYYKGLIQLRKTHAAFRIPTREMVQQHLRFLNLSVPNVVGYTLDNHVNGDTWKNILVIFNANRSEVKVSIPVGDWNVICHDGQINLNGISQIKDNSFTIAPSSASIMYAR